MAWDEIKKAVNSDLSIPLNELLTYRDTSFALPSDTEQAVVRNTETSTPQGNSVSTGSWVATCTGIVVVSFTIKQQADNATGVFFFCKTSSSSTQMANLTGGEPLYTIHTSATYTTYKKRMFVTTGTTYYFHIGSLTGYNIFINSIKILFDIGKPILAPIIDSDNIISKREIKNTLVTGNGTNSVTYIGEGQVQLVPSASQLTYYLTIDGDAERTLNLPAYGGVVTIPFQKALKIRGPAAGCNWWVITH